LEEGTQLPWFSVVKSSFSGPSVKPLGVRMPQAYGLIPPVCVDIWMTQPRSSVCVEFKGQAVARPP